MLPSTMAMFHESHIDFQGRSILDEERGPYSDEVRSILAKVAGRMTHAPNSLVMEQEVG